MQGKAKEKDNKKNITPKNNNNKKQQKTKITEKLQTKSGGEKKNVLNKKWRGKKR